MVTIPSQTILAHCIHLEKEELELMTERGVGVAHCPNSNNTLKSGLCDVRKFLDRGIPVGLGTGNTTVLGYQIRIGPILSSFTALDRGHIHLQTREECI